MVNDCSSFLLKSVMSQAVPCDIICDIYYVAYNPITLPCISFMFTKIKFIHCHSSVIFVMKFMSICNS